MFGLLLKVRFLLMFDGMLRTDRKKDKKKNNGNAAKVLMAILFLYVGGIFLFMFYGIFTMLCEPFVSMGLGWYYFGMAGLISVMISFICSVFTTQSQLFDAKDNELLLAMPVKPSVILGSRIVFLYITNLMYELLVMAPAIFVYVSHFPIDAQMILILAVVIILMPLLPLTLASLFGGLVALITSRMRSKTIFTMVLSIGFLAAYFYFYSQLNTYINMFVEKGEEIAAGFKEYLPPIYYFGSAVSDTSYLHLLLLGLWCVVPFALLYIFLSKSFIRIATAKRGGSKILYKEKELKVKSVQSALVRKEFRRFFSSAMYMMNACTGVIMGLLMVVVAIFNYDTIVEFISGVDSVTFKMLSVFAIPVVCFISSINSVSAPSISLEGNNLWILLSSPICGSDVLMAKVKAHIYICVPPTILISAFVAFFIKGGVLLSVLIILTPVVLSVLSGFYGVLYNLRFTRLDWISETSAVKQGASLMLAMFTGMGITIAMVVLSLVTEELMSVEMLYCIIDAVMIIITILMYMYIKGKGGKRFSEKYI